VLDNTGRPVGILTDRDLCRAVALGNRFTATMRVREFMTPKPATCSPSTALADALDAMAAARIRRLPVVDGQGRLVGIVSLSDVVSGIEDAHTMTGSPLLRHLVAAARQSASFRSWRPSSGQAPN
jgi:CBS-domain-containing membrane protein